MTLMNICLYFDESSEGQKVNDKCKSDKQLKVWLSNYKFWQWNLGVFIFIIIWYYMAQALQY